MQVHFVIVEGDSSMTNSVVMSPRGVGACSCLDTRDRCGCDAAGDEQDSCSTIGRQVQDVVAFADLSMTKSRTTAGMCTCFGVTAFVLLVQVAVELLPSPTTVEWDGSFVFSW